MSVFLLLGLVYLISDSGLQRNLIGLQRMRSNGQAFNPGIEEGIAEIEGKATRVGASECGQRASFNCCWPIRQASATVGRQRQAPSRHSRTRFFASGASHSESVRSYSLLRSSIVSGLRYMRVNAAVRRDRSRF